MFVLGCKETSWPFSDQIHLELLSLDQPFIITVVTNTFFSIALKHTSDITIRKIQYFFIILQVRQQIQANFVVQLANCVMLLKGRGTGPTSKRFTTPVSAAMRPKD